MPLPAEDLSTETGHAKSMKLLGGDWSPRQIGFWALTVTVVLAVYLVVTPMIPGLFGHENRRHRVAAFGIWIEAMAWCGFLLWRRSRQAVVVVKTPRNDGNHG